MPVYKTLFRVILSSPSDLSVERSLVKKIINEINDIHKESSFGLQLFTWEDDVYPSLTMHEAQIDIDNVFAYHISDLIIGLFHTKIGTPVLGSPSGTIHEIEQAINSYKQRNKPEIKLYFKGIKKKYSETTPVEREKFEQVEKAKNEYQKLGIVQAFNSATEFENLCRKHIMHYFEEQCNIYRKRAHSSSTMVSIKSRSNFERMEAIVGSAKSDIYILGINLEGALNLRDLLVEKSKNGVKIKLAALDPFGKSLDFFKVNNVSSVVKREKIINNLNLLYQYTQYPNIELRVVDNVFTSGCTGIDIETSAGRIVSQQYLFQVSTSEAPVLDIYADETPLCYNTYYQYLQNLWNIAKPYINEESTIDKYGN